MRKSDTIWSLDLSPVHNYRGLFVNKLITRKESIKTQRKTSKMDKNQSNSSSWPGFGTEDPPETTKSKSKVRLSSPNPKFLFRKCCIREEVDSLYFVVTGMDGLCFSNKIRLSRWWPSDCETTRYVGPKYQERMSLWHPCP